LVSMPEAVEANDEVSPDEAEVEIDIPEEKEEIVIKNMLSMPSRKIKVKITSELLQALEKMQINFKIN
jgi:DNA polymerase III subunit alpha